MANQALKKDSGPNRIKCLAVDVGMNDGFYSMLFASLGCKVYSFEVQPKCIEVASHVAAINNFNDDITIFETPITEYPNSIVQVPMGNESLLTCDGGFSIQGEEPNRRAHRQFERQYFRNIIGNSLDEIFEEKYVYIDLLKIDVEGHEMEVLSGSLNLFKNRAIGEAYVELQPKWWSKSTKHTLFIFSKIMQSGYILSCPKRGTVYENANDVLRTGCLDLAISKKMSSSQHQLPSSWLLIGTLVSLLLGILARQRRNKNFY